MTARRHAPLRGATIALIEHPRNPTASAALQRILDLDAKIVLVTPRPVAPKTRPGLHVIAWPTDSEDALHEALLALAWPPDAVLSFSHHFCAIAARVAKRLRVHGFDPSSLEVMVDKREVRERLSGDAANLSHWVVPLGDDLAARAVALSYPVVVKPTRETSSTNVRRVESPDEFVDAAQRVRRMRMTRKGTPLDGAVLVEELAEGPEYSVEISAGNDTFSCCGVTTKLPLASHPFIEQADTFPANDHNADGLASAALAAMRAFPDYSGPAHVEIRATADGPKLIEINGRQPGGFIPDLVRWTTGRDIFVEAVCNLLGVEPQDEEPVAGAATWWQIYPPRAGTVAACDLPGESLLGASVRVASMSCRVGDTVAPAEDNHGRLGDLVVLGDDPVQSLARAREVASRVHLDIV